MGFDVSLSLLTLLQGIYKYVKEKKNSDPELLLMVNDVMQEVVTVRVAYLEQMVKNQELVETIKELEAAAQKTASVQWDEHNGIWVDKENPGQGGYCPKCKTEREKLVPLSIRYNGWECATCGKWYSRNAGNPPTQQRANTEYDLFRR